MQILIHYKVDVKVRDTDGMSPSMWACRMDNIDHYTLVNDVMVNLDPRLNEMTDDNCEKDAMGRTIFHWSVRKTEPLECLKVGSITSYKDKHLLTIENHGLSFFMRKRFLDTMESFGNPYVMTILR